MTFFKNAGLPEPPFLEPPGAVFLVRLRLLLLLYYVGIQYIQYYTIQYCKYFIFTGS